jgi:hypothetical protein
MAMGSVFDRQCSRCGSRVMIAPSGQRLLRRKKKVKVLCITCAPRVLAEYPARDKVEVTILEGAAGEVRSAVPNLWRARN